MAKESDLRYSTALGGHYMGRQGTVENRRTEVYVRNFSSKPEEESAALDTTESFSHGNTTCRSCSSSITCLQPEIRRGAWRRMHQQRRYLRDFVSASHFFLRAGS
jgi:hypothetical protein